MNKVILIGRLTKDPELRYAAGSGTAVCRFTVAINRQFKKDETDFINCVIAVLVLFTLVFMQSLWNPKKQDR